MRPSLGQAVVLFSPPAILLAIALMYALKCEIPQWAVVLLMIVLAGCAIAAERVSLHMRHNVYGKKGGSNGAHTR